jgi:hypothetical protein
MSLTSTLNESPSRGDIIAPSTCRREAAPKVMELGGSIQRLKYDVACVAQDSLELACGNFCKPESSE